MGESGLSLIVRPLSPKRRVDERREDVEEVMGDSVISRSYLYTPGGGTSHDMEDKARLAKGRAHKDPWTGPSE